MEPRLWLFVHARLGGWGLGMAPGSASMSTGGGGTTARTGRTTTTTTTTTSGERSLTAAVARLPTRAIPGGEAESRETRDRLMRLLETEAVEVLRHLTHEPAKTSEESARMRGAPLSSGAKAMVFATGSPQTPLVMCVLSAARRISLERVAKELGVSRVRLAPPEAVFAATGCLPGAVPPFGSRLFRFTVLCDASLTEQGPVINFNNGLRTESVQISVQDYLRVEAPRVCSIAEAAVPVESTQPR